MDFLILMTVGLVLIILYHVAYSYSAMPGTKKHALTKFWYYKERILRLNNELSSLVSTYDAGDLAAFADSDVTFSEFIEALNEKYNIEYSNIQLQKIQESRMSKDEVAEFIDRMEQQQEIISSLQSSLKSRMRYSNQAIA